jgi:hypothetical protein
MIIQSTLTSALVLAGLTHAQPALADDDDGLRPGNLLVSRAVYDNNPNNVVAGVTQLPPGCAGSNCATATAGGTYPQVFNNDLVDASFGITSKIFLDEITPRGRWVNAPEKCPTAPSGTPRPAPTRW